MRLVVAIAAFAVAAAVSGRALAEPPAEPPEPIGKPVQDVRGRPHPLAPIPWFYREIDLQRDNVGAPGRKNSLREEQRAAESPSFRSGPFGDYRGW